MTLRLRRMLRTIQSKLTHWYSRSVQPGLNCGGGTSVPSAGSLASAGARRWGSMIASKRATAATSAGEVSPVTGSQVAEA